MHFLRVFSASNAHAAWADFTIACAAWADFSCIKSAQVSPLALVLVSIFPCPPVYFGNAHRRDCVYQVVRQLR